MSDESLKRVCVIHPNRAAYSETFIRNHIDKLPAQILALHGGWFPTRLQDDKRFLPAPLAFGERFKSRLPSRMGTLMISRTSG